MSICESFAHLFDSREAAEAWWPDMLCQMYTTACQLWHEEDDAVTLLYGGKPSTTETRRSVTGVVTRLRRKCDEGWLPATLPALEGFLWSRLNYEYKTLLCLRSGVQLWQPVSNEVLEVLGAESENTHSSQLAADERQARAEKLEAVRTALQDHPSLCQLLDAVTEEVLASEEADENPTGPGWRKRVLQRAGGRLGISQAALHQRLKRIRDAWEPPDRD